MFDFHWQKRESSDRRVSVLEQSQQEVNDQRLNDYKHAVIRLLRILFYFSLIVFFLVRDFFALNWSAFYFALLFLCILQNYWYSRM